MKKFMKGLLATTMVFAMMTSLVGCGGGSEAEAPADETTTLVMATNAAFPPYEFYEGDAIVGIDAEIGAAIAEKMGMDFVIEDMEFDAIIPAVASGKASFGIAGMITTTVLAVRSTPKALKLIEEKKKEEGVDKLTPAETVKTAWKCYIPAMVLGATSVGCLVGASRVSLRRNAALATAYKLSETALTEYREQVVETIGEKKEQGLSVVPVL